MIETGRPPTSVTRLTRKSRSVRPRNRHLLATCVRPAGKMGVQLANGEDAHRSQFMFDAVSTQIAKAVAKRRGELEALSRPEVVEEFQFAFQIRPDLQALKENLIERILAKVRAELERNS
jgi:hypothetical protein